MQTQFIYDVTELSRSNLYLIYGCKYKFRMVEDLLTAKKYVFTPLPGQVRKAELKLTRNKLATDCKLIVEE